MTTARPFDDFRALLDSFPSGDEAAEAGTRNILAGEALGRLEEVAIWAARWSGRAPPVFLRPTVALFAGSHGLAGRGVTRQPRRATQEFFELCAEGRAPVNAACGAHDLGLKLFELALELPTADISQAPALDEAACAATMAFGLESVAGGIDLICLAGLGDGASTIAATIFAMLLGGRAEEWLARDGSDELASRRAGVVKEAFTLHAAHAADPMQVLRRVGGREFAAVVGAIIAARIQKVPVILDGQVAIAAAAVVKALNPTGLDHCLLASRPTEPAHLRAAETIGLRPLLDLGTIGQEGVAAAFAAGVVKAAAHMASGLAPARP